MMRLGLCGVPVQELCRPQDIDPATPQPSMNVALKVENSVTENLRESALTSHLVSPRQLYCHYDQADRFNSASALL